MGDAATSYSHGTSLTPLIGETIGANLTRNARLHADREALVDRAAGRRWTYRELDADVDTVALGLLAARCGQGGAGRASGRPTAPSGPSCSSRTAKIGAILVNINPAYRTHELSYALHQSGSRSWSPRPSSRPASTSTWSTRSAPSCPASSDDLTSGPTVGGAAAPARGDATGALLAERGTAALARRPDQHPVHVGYDRASRRARPSRTTTSSTTGSSSASPALHEHDRVCIPVPFYHCFGMVMGNLGGHLARRVAW